MLADFAQIGQDHLSELERGKKEIGMRALEEELQPRLACGLGSFSRTSDFPLVPTASILLDPD